MSRRPPPGREPQDRNVAGQPQGWLGLQRGQLLYPERPAPAGERPGESGREAPPPAPPPPHLGGPAPRLPGLWNWSPAGGSGARGGWGGAAGRALGLGSPPRGGGAGPGRRRSGLTSPGSRPACSPPRPNLAPCARLLGAGHPPDTRDTSSGRAPLGAGAGDEAGGRARLHRGPNWAQRARPESGTARGGQGHPSGATAPPAGAGRGVGGSGPPARAGLRGLSLRLRGSGRGRGETPSS